MIIESIELHNFMCYSGENRFDFTEGMNVIIGDNNHGKSKLYDAFYWAMFDQCFDTGLKKWMPTRHFGKDIISDKAIHEAEYGIVRAVVRVTFKNLEKGQAYIIERRLTAVKREDGTIADKESEETVLFKEFDFMQGKVITNPAEVDRIKKHILPDNIRPYMWFQGEQVESIIDFSHSSSLTQAINVLSNITRYDQVRELALSLEKSANEEYQRKARTQSKDQGRSEELAIRRKSLVERLDLLEKEELNKRDTLSEADEATQRLMGQFEDASRMRDLDVRQKSAERLLDEVSEDEKRERIALHKKMFTQQWVLKGTAHLLEEYNANKYSKYEKTRLQRFAEAQARLKVENQLKEEFQTRLPINVPEPMYVNQMLENEICLVCNRPAEKDSEAWNSIKALLDRAMAKVEELEPKSLTKHDFSSDFKRLQQNGYAMERVISRIDSDIKSTFQNLRRLEKRRKGHAEDLLKITEEMNSMKAGTSLDPTKAKNIVNELQAKQDLIRRFQSELSRAENNIDSLKEQIKAIDIEMSGLVSGEMPAYLNEKKRVLEEFAIVAKSTRDRVFDRLVKQLEAEANKHYHEMMQGNQGVRGIIRLVESTKGNYTPRLTDENGNPLGQLNTGNIILIKLATIMAIISARQGSRDTDLYTLITDAPMSVFGEDYTIGFCKTVSHVYRQSIIMSKEFYKNENLRRELLDSPDIKRGKVYIITPSIANADRTNRNALTTQIKALN
jgi:DNA sulfur modification protein DndD